METFTDHDLSKVADKWAKEMPNEDLIGIRTAFAAGVRYAEKLYLSPVIKSLPLHDKNGVCRKCGSTGWSCDSDSHK